MLDFCQNEHKTKVKIREDQIEGRRLRLEEKKALVERLAHPTPPVQLKAEKKGKQAKNKNASVGRAKKNEPDPEPEPLPYLPTPDEIVLQKEGKVF